MNARKIEPQKLGALPTPPSGDDQAPAAQPQRPLPQPPQTPRREPGRSRAQRMAGEPQSPQARRSGERQPEVQPPREKTETVAFRLRTSQYEWFTAVRKRMEADYRVRTYTINDAMIAVLKRHGQEWRDLVRDSRGDDLDELPSMDELLGE